MDSHSESVHPAQAKLGAPAWNLPSRRRPVSSSPSGFGVLGLGTSFGPNCMKDLLDKPTTLQASALNLQP